jgi:hypothetical protein
LDDLCDSFDHVGTGIGHFVHNGWVRPYPIGHCPDSSRGQSYSGTETLVAISALRKERNLYAHQSDNACWDRKRRYRMKSCRRWSERRGLGSACLWRDFANTGCLRRTENTLSSSKKTSSLITWLRERQGMSVRGAIILARIVQY